MASQRVIGIDLGGTKLLAGVIDSEGRIERRHERPTPRLSQDELLRTLDVAIEEMLDDGIAAIALGIPSTIDQRSGRAISSVNVPLADVDVRERMRERFGLPVAIDNDGNCAAIAEWRIGVGRGTRHMIMLTLGTGIGGGLILDGRPYRGWIGAGAELGHMVLQHDGPLCQGTCTGRGHFEALASGGAATKAAHEALGPEVDSRELVRLAQEGDEAARAVLREVGRRLGSGIGSLVNIFNPELVVLGGGFAAAGELLLEPAREVLAREALAPGRDLVRVERAALGASAGLVGAGLVALEALEQP
ncbi:MAG: ROK family protein, partial [Actinobacteria bacterium]|nr:ROK family protein [Actinomycetota bacterium]